MEHSKTYFESLLQLFFPHNCLYCYNDAISRKHLLCIECFNQLPFTGFFRVKENPVAQTFYGRVNIEEAGACFYFSKNSIMQKIMMALKYKNIREAGIFLGEQMAIEMSSSPLYQDIDVIIPLPLNKNKLKLRGYNQAEIIARALSEKWNKPIITEAVERVVYTETQTHKSRVNRWQSMTGVFKIAEKGLVENKHILLVDDVVTTGATLEACSLSLLKCNAKVSIACAAWTTVN